MFPQILSFISGLFLRIVQIPLIAFYVFPILFIAIALQEGHAQFISQILIGALFIGAHTTNGNLQINGYTELASAVGVWVVIIQAGATVLTWWMGRKNKVVDTGRIAAYSLLALYVLGAATVLTGNRQGSILTYWLIMALFYGMAVGLLKIYQHLNLVSHPRPKSDLVAQDVN